MRIAEISKYCNEEEECKRLLRLFSLIVSSFFIQVPETNPASRDLNEAFPEYRLGRCLLTRPLLEFSPSLFSKILSTEEKKWFSIGIFSCTKYSFCLGLFVQKTFGGVKIPKM